MNFIKEAFVNEKEGKGFKSRRFKIIWNSKKCAWQHLMVSWGIRWSDKWQIFPIWNTSDNCHRELMFGFYKFHFTVSYARSGYFNQNRQLPKNRWLLKMYQLLS